MDSRKVLVCFIGLHLWVSAAVSSPSTTSELWGSGLIRITLLWLAFISLSYLLSRDALATGTRPVFLLSWTKSARWGEGLAFFLILLVMMQVYMTLKIAIPKFVPFYADPYIAQIDRLIFGTDSWQITHALLGAKGTYVLDQIYLWPCAIVSFGMSLWACFSSDRAFSRRSVLAICMSWLLLGSWVALLFSSAGPVFFEHFYGETDFSELASNLQPDLMAVRTQAYLLDNFGRPGFGKGISAMPSMHNATYVLLICMLYERFGNSWPTWIAVAFESVVFVASVHLGWHYAIDGIVSAVLVPIVWFAVRKFEGTPFRVSIYLNTLTKPSVREA